MAIQFNITQEDTKYFAEANGQKFFIGTETTYKSRHGLFNLKVSDGPVYKPEDYKDEYGFWAWFIFPTAMCESQGSFHCLNTYDAAAFTFTFMQFAAHVPNGDFVKYLRRLLELPEAKDYFPFLELREGKIWYSRNEKEEQLEGKESTEALMRYLNPDGDNIDDQELITAARFVHWAQNASSHRDLQVDCAIQLFRKKMKSISGRFELDGWPDHICHTICDILHQGRAKYSVISEIINSGDPRETIYLKLVNIGAEEYKDRIETLQATHKQLLDAGIFGKVYNAEENSFV